MHANHQGAANSGPVTAAGSGISDAPSDGTTYGRQNAAWVAVGGSSYVSVNTWADLPVTLGTPAVGTVYVVLTGSGIWLINRKPAGLYERTANNGVSADWTYMSDFPDAFDDANFQVYNHADTSKQVAISASGITTGTKRTWTAPDKSGTVAMTSDIGTAGALTADTDGSLTANSDSNVATQKATKTYADLKLAKAQNLSDLASAIAAFDNLSLHGADIASASTIVLSTATGDLVDVTGTTTITAITLADGKARCVRFTGALILTNGASLVLPGGANITTAAGDYAFFRGYAAGVVRCTVYVKASGKAIIGPAAADITDSTTVGRTLLTAANLAAQKTALAYTFADLAAGTFAASATFGENTELKLVAALSADGKYCGITETGVLGETVAFGEVCYFKAADSRWWKAKSDAASTAGDVRLAICVLAGTAAGATTMLVFGKIRADAILPTLTLSAPVHLSAATSGACVVAAPTSTDSVTRRLGFATTTHELFFNPSNDYYTHT